MMSFLLEYWQLLLIAIGVIVALGVGAYLYRNWQFLVMALTIAGAVLSIAKAFSNGSRAEKERQKLVTKKAIDEVKEVHREVDRMSNDDVDRELDRWVR